MPVCGRAALPNLRLNAHQISKHGSSSSPKLKRLKKFQGCNFPFLIQISPFFSTKTFSLKPYFMMGANFWLSWRLQHKQFHFYRLFKGRGHQIILFNLKMQNILVDLSICVCVFVSLSIYILIWTPCLMHRCVCIWWYILQNYNYKLHFQNLFIYDISHVSIGTLAAENLDVCTACDPWDISVLT